MYVHIHIWISACQVHTGRPYACMLCCTPDLMHCSWYCIVLRVLCVSALADVPNSLLKLVQDISMQLTFCNVDLAALREQSNPALLPFTSKCCMYPEKVFVSALCQSQFLIGQIRSQGYGLFGRQPTCFKPSTEGNAGVCLHVCVCLYTLYLLACLSFFCMSIESAHTLLLQLQENG